VWAACGGVEVKTDGDSFFVAFSLPGNAVAAAEASQRTITAHDWPGGRAPRVRIGVHLGAPQIRDGDYWGIDVHYAARLCSAANGGRVLLSESVARTVHADLDDLGSHALKDFPAPRRIFHLRIRGVAVTGSRRCAHCGPDARTCPTRSPL
jgi:class 3 adenylate cyclase